MINPITKRFFDFYSLSLLRYYAGENSLNHAGKANRIENRFANLTDSFYKEIRQALQYSVVREFRHFHDSVHGDFLKSDSDKYNLSKKIYKKTEKSKRNDYLENICFFNSFFNKQNFLIIYDGFKNHHWHAEYGGLLWAQATAFILQNPRNIKEKELWIDRVLDLQHNNGNLLDKTYFSVLSSYFQEFGLLRGKDARNRRLTDFMFIENATSLCPLDYRSKAPSISSLTLFASNTAKNLVKSNLNLIPERVR